MRKKRGSTMRVCRVGAVGLLAAIVSSATLAGTGSSATGSSAVAAAGAGTFGRGACSTGGQTVVCESRNLSFKLAAAGLGESASGYFERTNLDNGARFVGKVTCLRVSGRLAAIGGRVIRTPSPVGEGVGDPFLVYVSDNGLWGSPPDGISRFYTFGVGETLPTPGFPAACPAVASPEGYLPLISGGVLVFGTSV